MEERTLIAVVLSILVLIGFQYFIGPPPKTPTKTATNTTVKSTNSKNKVQNKTTISKTATNKNIGLSQTANSQKFVGAAKKIVVDTDLYHMVLTEDGGRIEKCLLKKYRVTVNPKSPPLNIVQVKPPNLPLGLVVGQEPGANLSNMLFKANKTKIVLNNNKKQQTLVLTDKLNNKISVKKVFTFHEGTYWIDLKIQVIDQGKKITSPCRIVLYNRPPSHKLEYVFLGPAYCTQGKLEQIKLKHPGDHQKFSGPLDWMGYDDGYFLSAVIPLASKQNWTVTMQKINKKGLVQSTIGPDITSKQQLSAASMNFGLYLGPKEITRLKALHHHLAEAVDFGWFNIIAKPLLYVLKFFNKFFHNYGISIIVLTIVIKILFWPLTHKGQKSMKTMQKLQPKLKKLKEKYGDDKERLNKELMQLYKTYKINPLGGCLPMVLQIPVFFALYKVLLQAIELRHAPFCLWINDLSAPDRLMIPGVHIPFLGGIPVLTLLMGVSMFIQQKMSPSSLDPMQSKMMLFMPIIFTVMFINFPSGLVLYWLVNNILSIIQQYYINKFTD